MGGGDISTYVFLPKIGANAVDITQHQAHHLMVFVGISGVASRLLIGLALKLFRPLTIWTMGCGGAAICFVVFPFLANYESLAIAAAFQGLFISAYISTQALSALDIFGMEKVNFVTGVLHFLTGIGALATPPVVGHLFEATEATDYGYLPSIAIGCVYATGLIFGIATYVINLRRKKQSVGAQEEVSFKFKRGSICVTLPENSDGTVPCRRDSIFLLTQ